MTNRLIGPSIRASRLCDLVTALREHAGADRPWLTFYLGKQKESLTTHEVSLLALRWARALKENGVFPGDRVVVLFPNSADFVGAFFGAQLVGATPVPVAWPFAPTQDQAAVLNHLQDILRVAEPTVIATTPALASVPFGKCVVSAPHESVLVEDAPYRPEPTSPAFIQFTSGSSGSPKGAVISQRAAVHSALTMGHALGLGPAHVGVSWLPLFHDMGLVGAMLCSLLHRFALHVMTPHEFLLHPDRWLRLVSEVGATITLAPNFGYESAARRVRPDVELSLESIEILLNGSEPVQRSTQDHFEARFSKDGLRRGCFRPVYGLAEATLGVCFSGANERPDLVRDQRTVCGVGAPLGGTEVEVRGEDNRVLENGCEGEIVVRGPTVMTEYFRAPEVTQQTIAAGWLHTGDLGVIQDGCLYVTGRKKELIIKAGQKFHPYEIERIVALAVDAAPNSVIACGRPSMATGTEDLVVAVELTRSKTEGAEAKIRSALVSSLGVRPDDVVIVRPGELPRTTSGKLRRVAYGARLVEERA